MKKISVGIIGVGRWGTNYLRTFSGFDDVEVVSICSRTRDSLKKAISSVKPKQKPKLTTNCNDVIHDPKIDAVAIASDASTHFMIAKQAFMHKKHVLVEKPVAFSSNEVKELIKISKAKNKILMAGHLHLFNPAIIKLKEDIQKGKFGK